MMACLRMPWVAVGLVLACLTGHAQELRDPTVAPPDLGGTGAQGAAAASLGSEGMAVIVREGKSYLAVGTRLYAPGQKVGQARLERITETEVWLREGASVRKIPRFTGIQRSVAAPEPSCGPSVPKAHRPGKTTPRSKTPSKAAVSGKTAPPSAPSSTASPVAACDGAQP